MLKLVILEYGLYNRTYFLAGLVNRSSKRLKGLDETLISEETGDKYPVSNSNSLGPDVPQDVKHFAYYHALTIL